MAGNKDECLMTKMTVKGGILSHPHHYVATLCCANFADNL